MQNKTNSIWHSTSAVSFYMFTLLPAHFSGADTTLNAYFFSNNEIIILGFSRNENIHA
jgi:hypothetical protein